MDPFPDGPPRSRAGRPARRALPQPAAYLLAAAIIGIAFFGSVTPSPLYGAYAARCCSSGSRDSSSGPRSSGFGTSVAELFVARGLQGIATGAAISAASAALLDLHPRRNGWAVSLANGVAGSAGIALGILTVSAVVQQGWAPLVLPYLLLLALVAAAFVGVLWMPETVERRRGIPLRFQRPRIPAAVRRTFALAALAAVSSWSLGGLFFSLGPQLGARLFDDPSPVVAGIGIVALGGAATLAQLVLGRNAPWLAAAAGSLGLASGVLLIVVATSVESGVVYLAGSVLAGAGFGIAFLGGLRGLLGSIPASERAAVLAAFYLVAYSALSLPAVVAGLLVGWVGLLATFGILGSLAAGVALATAGVAWRPDTVGDAVGSPA